MQPKVMLVGEAWGEEEERQGRAFVGPSGSVLHGLLKQAGIAKQDCYFTNVFNLRPRGNQISALTGPKASGIPGYPALTASKYIRKEFASEIDRLYEEIEREQPTVIIALGNTPLWALTKRIGIKKYRGAPSTDITGKWKIIPTWHPAAILRQWELRVIALADLSKAKKEMAFPEVRRASRLILIEPDLSDIERWYNEFAIHEPYLSCDIETASKSITEVGYSTACGTRAIVIPFYDRAQSDGNYWRTLRQESLAWDWVRRFNRIPQIGQNFQYDMKYFWRTVGIPTVFLGDTMLLHHSLQPELEKGLGFLGSIYTNEPSWKFMRQEASHLKRSE